MSRLGTIPYVYRTRGAAIVNIAIGVVFAIFALIFASVAFPEAGPDALYITCGLLSGLMSALSFFLGIGSLVGQKAEKRHDRA